MVIKIDKEAKRSEIAMRAIKLFAEKGFEKTTIKEIADLSGMGKSTIYEYFKTKEDILRQVSKVIIDDFANLNTIHLNNDDSPVKKIRDLTKSYINLPDEYCDIFNVYFELWFIYMRNKAYKECFEMFINAIKNARKTYIKIIDEGITMNIFKQSTDSESIARFIMASCDGIYLHYLFEQKKFNLLKTTTDTIDTLLAGMVTDERYL